MKQLGEEDSRTRDSQNWMNTFKMRELQVIPETVFLLFLYFNKLYEFFYSPAFLIILLCWQMNTQKQKGQTLNADSAQKAIDILKVCLNAHSSFHL